MFMNKFRKLGFIDYNGEIVVQVRCSTLCYTTSDAVCPSSTALPVDSVDRCVPIM